MEYYQKDDLYYCQSINFRIIVDVSDKPHGCQETNTSKHLYMIGIKK